MSADVRIYGEEGIV